MFSYLKYIRRVEIYIFIYSIYIDARALGVYIQRIKNLEEAFYGERFRIRGDSNRH